MTDRQLIRLLKRQIRAERHLERMKAQKKRFDDGTWTCLDLLEILAYMCRYAIWAVCCKINLLILKRRLKSNHPKGKINDAHEAEVRT